MPAFEITFSESTEPQKNRIPTVQTLLVMFVIVAVAALLNIFFERIGIAVSTNDLPAFLPVLGPGYYALLPWWNLYLILAFSFTAVLLILQQWYPPLRWIDLGLTGYAIGILIGTILNPTLIGPAPEWLAQQNLPIESMVLLENSVLPLGATLVRLVLSVVLLVIVGRTGKMLGEMGMHPDVPA